MKIKKGMMVRLSQTLSHTKRLWGLNDHMMAMKGTIREVKNIKSMASSRTGDYSTCIYLKDNRGSEWTFSGRDLSIPKLSPPVDPVMFDPKNL